MVLQRLAQVYLATGDHHAAHAHSAEARTIAEDLADEPVLALCLERVGEVAGARGQWREAARALWRAVEIDRRRGEECLAVGPLTHLADVLREEGDLDGATRCAEAIIQVVDTDTRGLVPDPVAACCAACRVFALRHDERGNRMLRKAREELDRRAALIADETLRHSFLEGNPVHRAVLALTGRDHIEESDLPTH